MWHLVHILPFFFRLAVCGIFFLLICINAGLVCVSTDASYLMQCLLSSALILLHYNTSPPKWCVATHRLWCLIIICSNKNSSWRRRFRQLTNAGICGHRKAHATHVHGLRPPNPADNNTHNEINMSRIFVLVALLVGAQFCSARQAKSYKLEHRVHVIIFSRCSVVSVMSAGVATAIFPWRYFGVRARKRAK